MNKYGYRVRKRVVNELTKIKLDNCYQYFHKIKSKMEEDSKLVLRYHVKKYVYQSYSFTQIVFEGEEIEGRAKEVARVDDEERKE